MANDREVLYFLQTVPGIGKKTIGDLWGYFGSGERIWQATQEELQKVVKTSVLKTLLQEREKDDPTSRLAKLEKKGIHYYSVFDVQYPQRLRAIEDRPWALFVRGKLPDETVMTASVIGARNHSYYGEKQTKQFAGVLAANGIGIVSGMARGIDSIAQETALAHGGETYAVLGCGVDVCYPEENYRLFEKIPEHGGIISEYLPGTMPRAGLFPMRNRIISALGDILLVMEAREKSGTLITVDMALEQGKEIWALPGRCDDVLSCGCNRLIAQGAGILTGVCEFGKELEVLKEKYGTQVGGTQNIRQGTGQKETGLNTENTTPTEKTVLAAVGYDPMSLNMIYDKINHDKNDYISIVEISVILTGLCMKGLCRQVHGSWYIRP